MLTTWVTYDGRALRPASKAAERALEALPRGEWFRVEVKQARNDRHHRMFFALLGLCVDALNSGPAQTTTDNLLRWLKVKLGYVRVVELPPNIAKATGESHAIDYQSISYAAMDQEAFARFAEEAMRLVRDQIAPWIEGTPQWAEVQEILAKARIEEPA